VRLILIIIALTLAACGPAGPSAPPDRTRIVEPRDDDGPAANLPGSTRRVMTACPNGGSVDPQSPDLSGAPIDAYASYDGQTSCDPTEKPGPQAFRELVLATYPCTSDGGIGRDCSSGGTSEHKEGRAWDWMINYPHPAADALLAWLTATDASGNAHANARRLGIMYMIWNNKIWKAYQASKGWQAYTGDNPHTDHVHFSFSWDGANKKTSFWSASPSQPEQGSGTEADAGVAKPKADGGAKKMDGGGLPTEPVIDGGGSLPGTPEPEDPGPQANHVTTRSDSMLAGSCSLSGKSPTTGLILALLAGLALVRRIAGRRAH